ncbi:putative membrane protein YagU involved in acid resistance [Lewinella aquimaris]|uniref:Putative membrane protein YagU involved in acid resistance n=1 Tax=Neolewinella aquimaris TaxID=1835722 RepID=A0A840E5H5_9BACT|nr:DUF1440 domain-containing protein [Neolewinella aquimaris]MBB4080894.1 putative membrane protein YagU involved in acid resistance [Neolewinella aquimaris]
MSFLDKIIDSVKDIDLTPVEKYASSAYDSAASTAKDAERYAVGAYHGAGDYFERTRTHGEPDYVRGFVAGMIGGLVGTGIKMIVDRSLPTAQPQEEHDARLQIVEGAEEVTNTDLNRNKEETAQQAINFAFGALVGGIYGVITEAAPAVQAPAGVPFGAALWTLAHKVALPALGLAPNPLKQDLSLQAGQLGSHMAYGATVEMVRRSVRHAMDQEDLL